MMTSRLKTVSLAVASVALATTVITATAQARSGSYRPDDGGPSINEPGPLCQTKLVRVCTTSNGRTYCKPTWQTICREVEAQ